MRRVTLLKVLMALCVLPALAAAQANPPDLDPEDGTVVADLASLPGTDEFATGNAIISFRETADTFEVQLSVAGLDSGTTYELVLGLNDEMPQIIGSFTTDVNGNGHLHVRLGGLGPFDRVEVLSTGDAVGGLTSLEEHGGSLNQVPSRGAN